MLRGLAIQGGGVAGIYYVGAIRRLYEGGDVAGWKCITATSAGSILGAFLALGADPDWLEGALTVDFDRFTDGQGRTEGWRNFYYRYGWYTGLGLESWLRSHIASLCGDAEITLQQVADRGCRLLITATEMNYPQSQLRILSPETQPDLPLWQAVKISCSIPIYFAAELQEARVFVDGGVQLNYPIELLRETVPLDQCLGLRLVSETAAEPDLSRPVRSHYEFMESMLMTWRQQAGERHISSREWARTVSIPCNIGALDFNISPEKIAEARAVGWQTMDHWLRPRHRKSL